MSWIAEYDTQGREFPTCVHVTKTTGTMTHGATYVPIEEGEAVRAENAKLREGLAVSIPLPLDGNRSAIHPDDIIGSNVGGTDFFGRVIEMHLTRYPRDGQPAVWVVKTEDDDGNVFPYVCWGGRCNVVHKHASQTYSAEYLETYDENKQLKAESVKLRKLVQDFDKCLTEAVRLAHVQGHATIYDGTLLDSLHPRMRELEIEVGE